MIPFNGDLAARLRMINEASLFDTDPPVAQLQRIREIQGALPELVAGQRFLATLQRGLPDGSFRALVSGQQMTLTLATPAKVGDTLELEVTQVTPRAVFARLAEAAGAPASAQPALSPTGRLISFLLAGQPSPTPATLAANQPLLAAPPASGAPLVPLLRQALGQSGMFYESHQAQWVLNKLDTATLQREPQGRVRPAPGTPGAAGGAAASQAAGAERAAAGIPAAAEEAAAPRATPIPERIVPLVHQQLDALATHHYVWHGQAWPGQDIEWIIEDPQDGGGGEAEAEQSWDTSLRLTLPRLGGIEARLHLTPAGVALRLRVDDEAARAALDAGGPALASALEAANLQLTGLVVERGDAQG